MTPDDGSEFESTETYYARYRPDYGEDVVGYLRDRYDLDGDARVLDLGCGTGQLAVPLAAHAGTVIGMDPNETMLVHARERAARAGVENVRWVHGADADLADADLAEDLEPLRLTTIGRAFHRMDQSRTLDRLYDLTEPGGGVALVNDAEWFTRGTMAWQDAVYDLTSDYLDDLPERTGPVTYDDPWDETVAAHGFEDVETRTFTGEREWTADGVVGYVFSLSYCSPKAFGEREDAFEVDLRALLADIGGPFVQDVTRQVISGRT